jgi:outer membrane protein
METRDQMTDRGPRPPSRRRRRPLRPVVVVALALAGAAGGAGAQEPAGVRPESPGEVARVVTFGEAVGLALERNTDLLRARADVELRGTVETREWMDFLPEVTVSTAGRRTFGRRFSQEEGAILSESSDVFDTGVTARLELFNGLERVASLRSASLREDASRLRLERAAEDVLYEVVLGFTTLGLDRELERVRAEELRASEELLAQVRRLVDLGRQPASDLYQQQAAQAEAEAALVEARRQVALAESLLMQVLELDPTAAYDFRVPEVPEPSDGPSYALDELLERALASRRDLRALERSVEASGHAVTAARSGYWPSVSLSFDYGSNWSSNSLQPVPGTGGDPRTVTVTPDAGGAPVTFEVPGTDGSPEYRTPDFFEQLSGRRGGSVTLSLNVPVFDRLRTRASVQEAEVARRNARYELQDRRQAIALEVRQALLDYESASARRSATSRRLEAAERAWRAARRRYELGAATFVEVAQARSQLVSARSAALQARYNVLLARRLIAYHTGALSPETTLFTDIEEAPDAS